MISRTGKEKSTIRVEKYTSEKVQSLFVREAEQSLLQEFLSFEKDKDTGFGAFRCMWAYEDETLGDSSYFVTFIDDHSRKLWVYFLKTKDQVLTMFK